MPEFTEFALTGLEAQLLEALLPSEPLEVREAQALADGGVAVRVWEPGALRPRYIRGFAARSQTLSALERHGWVRGRLEPGPEGAPRRLSWSLTPAGEAATRLQVECADAPAEEDGR